MPRYSKRRGKNRSKKKLKGGQMGFFRNLFNRKPTPEPLKDTTDDQNTAFASNVQSWDSKHQDTENKRVAIESELREMQQKCSDEAERLQQEINAISQVQLRHTPCKIEADQLHNRLTTESAEKRQEEDRFLEQEASKYEKQLKSAEDQLAQIKQLMDVTNAEKSANQQQASQRMKKRREEDISMNQRVVDNYNDCLTRSELVPPPIAPEVPPPPPPRPDLVSATSDPFGATNQVDLVNLPSSPGVGGRNKRKTKKHKSKKHKTKKHKSKKHKTGDVKCNKAFGKKCPYARIHGHHKY